MIKHLLILFIFIITSSLLKAQALSGIIRVGNGETYTNLTQAFADIKTKSIQDTLALELTPSYDFSSETLPIVFPAFVFAAETDRIIIRPNALTPKIIMEATLDTAMFIFENSIQTIFEGRRNGDWERFIVARNKSTNGSVFLVKGSSYDSEISAIEIENAGKYSAIINTYVEPLFKYFTFVQCKFSDRQDEISENLPDAHIYSAGSLDHCPVIITMNEFLNFKYNAININHTTSRGLSITYNSIYFNHPTYKILEPQTLIKIAQITGEHHSMDVRFNYLGGSNVQSTGSPYNTYASFTGIHIDSKDDLGTVAVNVISNISVIDTVNPSAVPFRGFYLSSGVWPYWNRIGRDFFDEGSIKVLSKLNNASVYGIHCFFDSYGNRKKISENKISNIQTNASNIYGIQNSNATDITSNTISELRYLDHPVYKPLFQNYYGIVTNVPENEIINNMIYLGKGINSGIATSLTLLKVNGSSSPLNIFNNNFYFDDTNNVVETNIFIDRSSWSGRTNIYNNIFADSRLSLTTPFILSKLPSDLSTSLNSIDISHNSFLTKSKNSYFLGSSSELYSFDDLNRISNNINYYTFAPAFYLFTKTNIGSLELESSNSMLEYIDNLGRPIMNNYYDWFSKNLRSVEPKDGLVDIGAEELDFSGPYFAPDLVLNTDTTIAKFAERVYLKFIWKNSERPASLSSYFIQKKLYDSTNYSYYFTTVISTPKDGLLYDYVLNYDDFAMAGFAENTLRLAAIDEGVITLFDKYGTQEGEYEIDSLSNNLIVHGLSKIYANYVIVKGNEVLGLLDENILNTYSLSQNYPNPFNPETTINFNLAENTNVKVDVYNVNGELVKSLFAGELNSGQHSVNFEGRGLASGTYIYRITTPKYTESKKMILVK